jgi:hypothetical protein
MLRSSASPAISNKAPVRVATALALTLWFSFQAAQSALSTFDSVKAWLPLAQDLMVIGHSGQIARISLPRNLERLT